MRWALPSIVALLGCDAALGIEDLPRAHTGGGNAPIAYAVPLCAECTETECPKERDACVADRSCRTLYTCNVACKPDDVRCRSACERATPGAVDDEAFRAVDRCHRKKCTTECIGLRGLGELFGKGCACLDQQCSSQSLACVTSGVDGSEPAGACERRLACVAHEGGDPDSVEVCGSRVPHGEKEVGALRRCWAEVGCPGCGIARGGAYECLRKYRWELPVKRTVQLTMNVSEFDAALTAVPNATVRACPATTCGECTSPVTSGITNEAGVVTLELPTGVAGFGGCFEIEAKGHVTTLLHLGHPIVRDVRAPAIVLREEGLPLLGTFLGAPVEADKGHVVAFSLDCLWTPSSGLRVEIEPKGPSTKRGYFVGSLLDPDATSTGNLGMTVFANVPPGLATLRTFRGETPITTALINVRAGKISGVITFPRPED